MTELLATVQDVARWSEEDLTEGMERVAEAALELASDEARNIGNPGWDSVTVPGPVRRIVARAVARYLVNPDGYETSRAGDETLGWKDRDGIGEVTFTPREIERLASYRLGPGGLVSVGTTPWNTRLRQHPSIYVPTTGPGGTPFPFLEEEW